MIRKESNIAVEEEEEYWEPVSPTGRYFNSSVISISNIIVLDSETPIDDSPTLALLKDVFLPINPRFTSIMVKDEKGREQWKKVEVKLEDHINIPVFPPGLSPESYDDHLSNYLSKIAMEQLPQYQPLWNIHIIKYPTTNAAGNLIFKLHHALGDGYSLMGALLSCLKRADNPSIPLTFPSRTSSSSIKNNVLSKFRNIPKVLWYTISDFAWSLMKSNCVKDDISLIRSGESGVEFKPIVFSTMTFSLDHIKQIKTKLGVTINDVITGIIFLGTRLYMQGTPTGGSSSKLRNERSTAIVLFNTRNIREYKSVEEMLKPGPTKAWGNQVAMLFAPLPEITGVESYHPLDFVRKAHKLIQRQRSSGAVFLTASLFDFFMKCRGPEATAKYIHRTIHNTSISISNMIGPVERMALADHPVKSVYFMCTGVPQSLNITLVSYMGHLRICLGAEKDYIDSPKLKSSIENAFQMMLKAVQEIA